MTDETKAEWFVRTGANRSHYPEGQDRFKVHKVYYGCGREYGAAVLDFSLPAGHRSLGNYPGWTQKSRAKALAFAEFVIAEVNAGRPVPSMREFERSLA